MVFPVLIAVSVRFIIPLTLMSDDCNGVLSELVPSMIQPKASESPALPSLYSVVCRIYLQCFLTATNAKMTTWWKDYPSPLIL